MSDNIQNVPLLPVEALLAALINYQNNRGKLKLLEVEDTTDNYFEDAGLHQTNEELFRMLVDVDDDGDFALRVGFHTVTGSTKFAHSEASPDLMVRSLIGKAADGKPYLRLVLQAV